MRIEPHGSAWVDPCAPALVAGADAVDLGIALPGTHLNT